MIIDYLKYVLRRQGKYHLHSPFVYDFYIDVLDNLPRFGWRDVLFTRMANFRKPSNVLVETNVELRLRLNYAIRICDKHKAKVYFDFDGTVLNKSFPEPIDFVYIDGKMGKSRIKGVSRQIKNVCSENTVILFDRIYHRKTNKRMWNYLVNDPKVSLSMDCYRFGLVFFKKRPEKQHFVLKT